MSFIPAGWVYEENTSSNYLKISQQISTWNSIAWTCWNLYSQKRKKMISIRNKKWRANKNEIKIKIHLLSTFVTILYNCILCGRRFSYPKVTNPRKKQRFESFQRQKKSAKFGTWSYLTWWRNFQASPTNDIWWWIENNSFIWRTARGSVTKLKKQT